MDFSEYISVERPIFTTLSKIGWEYKTQEEIDSLRHSYNDILLKPVLKNALQNLNPITPQQADDIIHKLSWIDDSEEFYQWLKGNRSFKPSPDAHAISIRLIDTEDISNNDYWVTNQYVCAVTRPEGKDKTIRPDLVLFINGIPITIVECKVLSTAGSSWKEGIRQLERYQRVCPELFVPNVFNISTDGFKFKYGATGVPERYFFEWKYDAGTPPDIEESSEFKQFAEENDRDFNPWIDSQVYCLLRPDHYTDLITNFVVYETRENVTIKKIGRYQQFRAVDKIVRRVLDGSMKTGLIWHTQGSGKSLTMLFTAWKLRKLDKLNNPTVLIVVDRIDLDTQISDTFQAVRMPDTSRATSMAGLRKKLEEDRREVIITTIFKFQDIEDVLVDRDNVVILIDEAHRTQEGDNAAIMRRSLPNAYFFGFTGTPIDKNDLNTHRNFGLRPDGSIERYMDLYKIKDAIDDNATVPVHYQLQNRKWFLTTDAIDKIVDEQYAHLNPETLDQLKQEVSRYETFMLDPDRLQYVADHLVNHFSSSIEPRGFKAQLVCYNRKSCALLKERLDKIRGPEFSSVIFSAGQNDQELLRRHHKSKDDIKKEISNFKNPDHPLKVLIVQNMLLTGFDAPIEQVMYLDRPLKDHSLLQAIARTNRPYPNKKCGIIIDFCGVLKNLNAALNFNEDEIDQCLIDFAKLKEDLPEQLREFYALIEGANVHNLSQCLKYIVDNEKSDEIREAFKKVQLTYDTLSPDPFIVDHIVQYRTATKIVMALDQLQRQEKPDVSAYLPQTQEIVQDYIKLREVDETVPVFKIDDNYLSRLDGKELTKEQKELTLEHRIRSILRIKIGDLPVYKTLQERLESIIKRKNEEAEDTEFLLRGLFIDVVTARKEEEQSGESKGYRAIKQILAPRISNNPELLSELSANLDEKIRSIATFENWQLQSSVVSNIKRQIIITLAQYSQQKQDLAVSPDEYSSFVGHMMNYIQKYY